MQKKKQKKSQGANCPICGTHYKIASMAKRCRRTPECVYFLYPGDARKRTWLAQSFLYILCHNLATGIISEPVNDTALALANSVVTEVQAMQKYLKTYNICAKDSFRDEEDKMVNLLIKIFGSTVKDKKLEIPVPVATLARALSRLCNDVIVAVEKYCEDFGFESDEPVERWLGMQALLDQISEVVDGDDESGMIGPEEAYKSLRTLLFGAEKEESLPSLYECFGDTIVLAFGRAQVKQVLLNLRGWKATGKDIEGISPGEVFGDGRTAMDVIMKYKDAAPCIVGASA